jgi:hypothetical protein
VTEPEYEYDVTALFVSCFDYTISLHRFEGPAVIVVSTMIDQSAHKRYVFLDSGANISVFSDPKDCYDFYDESISAGTIAGTTEFHQRATHRVWGEGVYHSGAMYDLVSLSGAIQHGFSVRFERNCFILEKGHLKFLARMQNGLFPIVSSASISSPNVANYHRVDIDKTSLIWMLHLSLDHITKPYLVRMIKNGSLAHWGSEHLLLSLVGSSNIEYCEECLEGKMTASSESSSIQSTEPGTNVHADLIFVGPTNNKSIFLFSVDTTSKYKSAVLLPSKAADDIFDGVKKTVAIIPVSVGKPPNSDLILILVP